ncbi:uncharacterized protein LOC126558702 [Anopheles maculipalpis]|uniref:uncharacterized protein LOC126558702 n=1 Tax=Anopheles maculipalpis TaxID=1496333 RepID=UPI002158D18C|nr:uncharacterized protein LOC126558702 [Anopheles maculipalpis]
MDKAAFAAKRRQDKLHKKPPPPKQTKQKSKQKAPEVQHTAPLVVYDDRYGKRQLQQNWTKDRDLPSSDSDADDGQLQAADFEKLLELPPSSANHFLLSSEKRWLQPDTELPGDDEKNDYSEYFRIDTKLLNASLGCIPFYERHGYDPELFSTLEINLMRQKAEINTKQYQQKFADQLSSHTQSGPVSRSNKENMPLPKKPSPTPCLVGAFAKPKDDSTTIKSPVTKHVPVDMISINPIETKMSELEIHPEQREKVAEVMPTSVPTVQPVATKPNSSSTNDTKEDIQQWLDDILDI